MKWRQADYNFHTTYSARVIQMPEEKTVTAARETAQHCKPLAAIWLAILGVLIENYCVVNAVTQTTETALQKTLWLLDSHTKFGIFRKKKTFCVGFFIVVFVLTKI